MLILEIAAGICLAYFVLRVLPLVIGAALQAFGEYVRDLSDSAAALFKRRPKRSVEIAGIGPES